LLGGGLDVFVGKKIALRLAQFDYLPIHTDANLRLAGRDGATSIDASTGGWQNNSRFQTGIVFRFGTK
jgi:hypothetical protein